MPSSKQKGCRNCIDEYRFNIGLWKNGSRIREILGRYFCKRRKYASKTKFKTFYQTCFQHEFGIDYNCTCNHFPFLTSTVTRLSLGSQHFPTLVSIIFTTLRHAPSSIVFLV